MSTSMASPLLKGHGLPTYEQIKPELVLQDIPVLLKELEQQFTELEQTLQSSLDRGAAISCWPRTRQSICGVR